RNFLDSFLRPLFQSPDLRVRLVSGSHDDLVDRLLQHNLDLVLGNRQVPASEEHELRSKRVARQPVSLVGPPTARTLSFPDDIEDIPLLVPSPDSAIRTSFDALCEQRGVRPRIVAEVDDMALLRLLTRDMRLVALLPAVVVRDELQSGVLKHHGVVGGLDESFYATTRARRFPHPLLEPLLDRTPEEILQMAGGGG
ncbi:MAG: LysR substrate-binding domain-containing protein, partial [Myxococcota bacterium]